MFCCLRFVKIKVPTNAENPSDTYVHAAARARCLAQSAVSEQVLLHLNAGTYVSAMEYRVACKEQPSQLPPEWSQPQQVAVVCRFPEVVEPFERQTATPGLDNRSTSQCVSSLSVLCHCHAALNRSAHSKTSMQPCLCVSSACLDINSCRLPTWAYEDMSVYQAALAHIQHTSPSTVTLVTVLAGVCVLTSACSTRCNVQ